MLSPLFIWTGSDLLLPYKERRGMDVIKNEEQLAQDLKDLSESVKKMALVVQSVEKKQYFSILEKPWKFILFSFLQGVATTLGATIGVGIIVALVIIILQQLGFTNVGSVLQSIFPVVNKVHLVK